VATNAEKLAAVEASISKINPAIRTLSVAAHISDTVSVAKLFAKVEQNFGHANILVNNAALATGGGNIHEEDPQKWWRNFVSLASPFPPLPVYERNKNTMGTNTNIL
jgi:NAD(P)-dependent dehydrogenase (short-subunit alcohol dehydrogenase family)